MKILILGSGSFAGQATFSKLLKDGYEVYGINRSKPKKEYMWNWVKGVDLNKRWHVLNICDDLAEFERTIDEIKPTHIIDFLGQGMVAQSWIDPELWYQTNISKKASLLEKIRKINNLEKYIRISTPEVYGSSKSYLDEKVDLFGYNI